MKRISVIIFMLILIFTITACNKEVSADAIVNSTNEVWDNSVENETTTQVIFKNLNVGGVMKIDNLILNIEKKVSNDKILINVTTPKNMSIKIDDKVKGIIDMVLDYKKLEGNLKVKHLEQAFSKIGIKANLEIDKNSVNGAVEILNIKDMFKENLSKPLKIDIKMNNLANNEGFKNVFNDLKSHPIKTFLPSEKSSFNLMRETPVTFSKCELCDISDSLFCGNCDKTLNNSEYSIKRIVYDIFSTVKVDEIVNDTITLDKTSAKFNLGTKNGKKYVDSMNVKGKLNIKISKTQLDTLAKDLTGAYQNEKLYNIYKSIINLLNYEDNFIQSDLDIVITNNVVK